MENKNPETEQKALTFGKISDNFGEIGYLSYQAWQCCDAENNVTNFIYDEALMREEYRESGYSENEIDEMMDSKLKAAEKKDNDLMESFNDYIEQLSLLCGCDTQTALKLMACDLESDITETWLYAMTQTDGGLRDEIVSEKDFDVLDSLTKSASGIIRVSDAYDGDEISYEHLTKALTKYYEQMYADCVSLSGSHGISEDAMNATLKQYNIKNWDFVLKAVGVSEPSAKEMDTSDEKEAVENFNKMIENDKTKDGSLISLLKDDSNKGFREPTEPTNNGRNDGPII